MDGSVIAALSLGFGLGLRHALDADHLVAVSTIVSEHKSLWRSSLVGTFWGLGHTASLLGVGVVVLLLRITISERAAPWMEMPVAAMLIGLGAVAVYQALRQNAVALHSHTHAHQGESEHTHLHLHARREHDHTHRMVRIGKRPFLVGLVHGFAGSAALMLAVLTTLPSVALGLLYIAVFGIGSIGGMVLMSAMISLPFIATANRFASVNKAIRLTAGLFSIGFGLLLVWELLGEIVSRPA
jgi:ABC-type nickel/cobalt efflux system permease component RcnA